MFRTNLPIAATMVAAFAGNSVGRATFPAPWVVPENAASAQVCLSPSDGAGTMADAGDAQQAVKVYRLKHAGAEPVAGLLRSLFVVVNEQDPYVRFYFDEITNSLIVGASRQHQRQIGSVLAMLDRPDDAPAQAIERGELEQRVIGYSLKQVDGNAAAAVLRSLFLVVNHRVAYTRFAFDPRTRLLIAIASQKHQKQITRVLELLKTQNRPATAGAKDDDTEQQVHVYPIKGVEGEHLIAKLRSQFVVVNHQQAEARFGFDKQTHSLIVIAAGNVRARIRDAIAAFEESPQK